MLWAEPTLSHHACETTSCVLALCNTEYESIHLMAVGTDDGNINLFDLETRSMTSTHTESHRNKINGIEFYNRTTIISHDNLTVLLSDAETSGRDVLLDIGNGVNAITIPYREAPIIAATDQGLYRCDQRSQAVKLNDFANTTEACLLPDCNTLFSVRMNQLNVSDLRMPEVYCSCKFPISVEKLATDGMTLAVITDMPDVYTFDLPLIPTSYREHIPLMSPFHNRPAFFHRNVVVTDGSGCVFIIDPKSDSIELIQCPLQTPTVSVAASDSEIAVAFEDDIYIYSQLPFEDNLIRVIEEFPEEEDIQQQEGWLQQSASVVTEEGECTYEKFGYADQLVYVCLDCMHPSQPFGVCEQCVKSCHRDHNVRCIGVRRRFRCDCGNGRSRRPCQAMLSAKTVSNTRNEYGHNFFDRWCTCDGEDAGEMTQCVCCSDWFHTPCIGVFPARSAKRLEDFDCVSEWCFVCRGCLDRRLTFLKEVPDAPAPAQIAPEVGLAREELGVKVAEEEGGLGFTVGGGRFLPKDWGARFADQEEYRREFDPIDSREEDRALPKAEGQTEYVRAMRELYTNIFAGAAMRGKTVIQPSDVSQGLSESVAAAIRNAHRRQGGN